MKVLVTGYDGYVGTVLVPFFQRAGIEVYGIDTFFFQECKFGEQPANGSSIPLVRKDTRDIQPEDLDGFDAVVHLAALSNDPLGNINPDLTYDINYHASVKLAKTARAAGVERFAFASSCSMYGIAGDDFLTEEASLNPVTPYAISKVRTEDALRELATDSFSPIFMRNATAYGVSPRLRLDIVLNNLVAWAFTTGKIRILSDGSPWRPLVHVEDMARAFLAVLQAPRELVHNQAFNVGVTEHNYRIRDLAEIVQQVVPNCDIEYAPQPDKDSRTYRVDFTKIKSTLGDYFRPEWDAHKGAESLYQAYHQAALTLDNLEGRLYTRLKQLNYLIDSRQLDNSLRWKNNSGNPING
jgi:nucleoside-diphosphate-sugar epimerase